MKWMGTGISDTDSSATWWQIGGQWLENITIIMSLVQYFQFKKLRFSSQDQILKKSLFMYIWQSRIPGEEIVSHCQRVRGSKGEGKMKGKIDYLMYRDSQLST